MTPTSPESLNCETALERLDAVWLDPLPEEPLDADLIAAREHVQDCSVCWATWESRRSADRKIADVMQAVAVPTGLREQLLAQSTASAELRGTGGSPVPTTDQVQAGRPHHKILHRRAWWISVAAMLLVSAAGGSWLWQTMQPRRVSMQTLCDQTPLSSSELEATNDPSQLPPLPATWLRAKGLRTDSPRQFTPPDSRATSWVAFELRANKKSTIKGVLLATRQADVTDPPAALIVRPTWVRYTSRDGKPVSVAGWSEQGVVYLCFVPGEPALLDQVLRATAPTSA